MLFLVGVGHVFPLREKIKNLIVNIAPDAICVELDQLRYRMLLERERRGSPFPFSLLSKMYDRASEVYGAEVGEEMLGAVEAANELNVPYFFIDVPIQRELPTALGELPLGERIKLVLSAFAASLIPRSLLKKATEEIINNPERMSKEFAKHYPELKEILLDRREAYMSNRISRVTGRFNRVVAVVGEGHIEGLLRRFEGMEVKVIHLKDLLSADVGEVLKMESRLEDRSSSGVKFQFNVDGNPWEGMY